jgi:hypothetical protein
MRQIKLLCNSSRTRRTKSYNDPQTGSPASVEGRRLHASLVFQGLFGPQGFPVFHHGRLQRSFMIAQEETIFIMVCAWPIASRSPICVNFFDATEGLWVLGFAWLRRQNPREC